MPEIVARSFALPWGILPRMELLAAGWVKPGDEFKRAEDRAWWTKRYAHPLWEPLRTYAKILDDNSIGVPRAFDEEIAAGKPSAISRALTSAGENLDAIRKDGSDVCAPFLIPARNGVMPVRNDVCQAALNGRKATKGITDGIVDTIQKTRAQIQFWVVAAVVVVIVTRNRR